VPCGREGALARASRARAAQRGRATMLKQDAHAVGEDSAASPASVRVEAGASETSIKIDAGASGTSFVMRGGAEEPTPGAAAAAQEGELDYVKLDPWVHKVVFAAVCWACVIVGLDGSIVVRARGGGHGTGRLRLRLHLRLHLRLRLRPRLRLRRLLSQPVPGPGPCLCPGPCLTNLSVTASIFCCAGDGDPDHRETVQRGGQRKRCQGEGTGIRRHPANPRVEDSCGSCRACLWLTSSCAMPARSAAQQVSWIVISFMLGNAIMAPLVGRLAEILGRRFVLVAGTTVFTIFSVCCALSDFASSIWVLVAMRFGQGIGGGSMIVSVMVLSTCFLCCCCRGLRHGDRRVCHGRIAGCVWRP
jgi:hypothetical protein